MKKLLLLLLLVIVSTQLFTSCIATRSYISETSVLQKIEKPKEKHVIISVEDDIRVNNFTKTFKKNYTKKSDFASTFTLDFLNIANKKRTFASVTTNEVNKWKVLDESKLEENQQKIDSLFNKVKGDYLINFSDFEITNRIETFHHAPAMGPNGTFAGGRQTTTEYCIVNAKVAVYDLITRKKIIEFVSVGEKSVFLFNFKDTLNKAKMRAIEHAIDYINSGKTTYIVM